MLERAPYNEKDFFDYVGRKREKTFLFWVGTGAPLSLVAAEP